MHAADTFPSHQHQQIAVGREVRDCLELNLSVGVGNLGVISDDALHELAISFYGLHC